MKMGLGGGGFLMESDNPLLDDHLLERTGRSRPRACLLPTASGDAPTLIARFHAAFQERDVEANHLTLFGRPRVDLREFVLGHDLVYFMQRSIVAPPKIPADAQAYYVDLFQKVYNTKDWQDYLSKKGLLPGWLTGDKLTAYFVKEKEAHRNLLVNMGEIN